MVDDEHRSNPVFLAAMAEIESLGVTVAFKPVIGSKPYAIIGGRSNLRWWLLPLENRHVTSSGLALFQPMLASSYWMKISATRLSQLGLSSLWAKPCIYLSGQPTLASHFTNSGQLSYAYFTGTNSSSRKLTVQIMGLDGHIKGYAKVSCDPRVHGLIEHESNVLTRVQQMKLEFGLVPQVLYAGLDNGVMQLVTDTRKTPKTKPTRKWLPLHQAFLQELVEKSRTAELVPISMLCSTYKNKLDALASKLDEKWYARLNASIELLSSKSGTQIPVGINHGDFTPWNTFISEQKLYVFDWEYAESKAPLSNDKICYFLNEKQPTVYGRKKAKQLLSYIMKEQDISRFELLIYLTDLCLRWWGRLVDSDVQEQSWDNEVFHAKLLDDLLSDQ